MFFDNEKLNNKETFDKFHKINQNYLKKEPLITFEIQIRNKADVLNRENCFASSLVHHTQSKKEQ